MLKKTVLIVVIFLLLDQFEIVTITPKAKAVVLGIFDNLREESAKRMRNFLNETQESAKKKLEETQNEVLHKVAKQVNKGKKASLEIFSSGDGEP